MHTRILPCHVTHILPKLLENSKMSRSESYKMYYSNDIFKFKQKEYYLRSTSLYHQRISSDIEKCCVRVLMPTRMSIYARMKSSEFHISLFLTTFLYRSVVTSECLHDYKQSNQFPIYKWWRDKFLGSADHQVRIMNRCSTFGHWEKLRVGLHAWCYCAETENMPPRCSISRTLCCVLLHFHPETKYPSWSWVSWAWIGPVILGDLEIRRLRTGLRDCYALEPWVFLADAYPHCRCLESAVRCPRPGLRERGNIIMAPPFY